MKKPKKKILIITVTEDNGISFSNADGLSFLELFGIAEYLSFNVKSGLAGVDAFPSLVGRMQIDEVKK